MSIKSFIIVFLVLSGAGYAAYRWRAEINSYFHPSTQSTNVAEITNQGDEKPIEKFPVVRKHDPNNLTYDADRKLPSMQESDLVVQSELISLFGKDHFEKVFIPEDLIGHFVMTIVNATEKKIQTQLLPFKAPEGKFLVSGSGAEMQIDSRNYDRYSPYVALLQLVDAKKLVALYSWLYSLFQEAYRDLGTDGFFNDKVIAALDNIAETPEIKEPILLTRPLFYYKFADPELESLSVAQKFIQRMGPGNAALVKTMAREFRRLLTHLNK